MKLLKYWYVLIPFALGLAAGLILNFTPIDNPPDRREITGYTYVNR